MRKATRKEEELIKISDPIELQLDNLVYNKHRELHRISINDFSRFRHPDMGGDYGLYAIPLTEEWLEKFGFHSKYKSNHMRWNILGFDIDQAPDEDEHGNSILQAQEFYYKNQVDVKYVHQLQMLYFVITGKELIPNL